MTRILTITSWYPPHHYGGYELSCFDVMTRLVARGHQVRILCGDERLPGALDADPRHEALVYRELRPHLWEATTSRPSLRDRVAIERHNRLVLERQLADFQPDVVSVWHMVAISMSLIRQLVEADIPLVYVVCDNWLLYGEQQDAWMSLFSDGLGRRMLGRLVEGGTGLFTSTGDLGATGAFCFVSDHTRRRALEAEPWSYPFSTVVYSGIDHGSFPVVDAKAEQRWRGRLLYVGRLDAWKGVDTLLRAVTLLPADTTLTCYGRGGAEQRARLGRLAETLGISERVSFGSLERHELAARYQSADAVVFPSEWDEPFGLVPLEAMACGTPVVATGVGGSAEFLRDGYNSVLFPAGDAVKLAAALQRLEGDGALRDRIRCGGRKTAHQLDVEKLADVLESWHAAAAHRFRYGSPPDRNIELPPPVASDEKRGAIAPVIPEALEPLSDHLTGRVLDVVRPEDPADRPAMSVRMRSQPDQAAAGATVDAPGHLVAAQLDCLPFRTGVFDGLLCDRAIECSRDDVASVHEVARVLRQGGRALFIANSRRDAAIARLRIRDRLVGLKRPERAYLHSPANIREYSPEELAALLDPILRVRAKQVLGWRGSWKSKLAALLCGFAPFDHFASGIALETERR